MNICFDPGAQAWRFVPHSRRTAPPICDRSIAIRAAGQLLAAKACLPDIHHAKFDRDTVFVEEPGNPPRWYYHTPTREEAQRVWVQIFAGPVAEHHDTGEDLHDVLCCAAMRDRERMEWLSGFLNASDHERAAIKKLTEAIVFDNAQSIKSLANEIQRARRRISTNHPILAGVPFIADWVEALRNPWK